jgi:hypothetical protein
LGSTRGKSEEVLEDEEEEEEEEEEELQCYGAADPDLFPRRIRVDVPLVDVKGDNRSNG